MKTQSTRARLLASSMICGAVALAGGSAFAQSTTPQTESNVSEVVVTGSRIPSKDFTANSPYVSVNADTIKQSGAAQIDTLLNQLPQFTPFLTTTSNNPGSGGGAGGGPGSSQLNLRGLGSNRNLILLDGRRIVPNNGVGAVDVNLIPAALIERVEIITGGASAVYGSDAISGVVNFILKDHYQGMEITSQYGISSRGDGREWAMNSTVGGNFADGKGNIVLNASFDRRDNILQGDREFSSSTLAITQHGGAIALGSGTIPDGRYDASLTNLPSRAAVNAIFAGYGLNSAAACNGGGGALACSNSFGFQPNGTLFNVATGGHFLSGNPLDTSSPTVTYNYGAVNNLTLPFQRYNLFVSSNYSIWGDYLKVFLQALYTRTTADNQLAASPATGLTIPVSNPYIPADLATLLASRPSAGDDFVFRRRFVENGPRIDANIGNAFQILGGLKGTFNAMGHDWSWEGFFQNGRSQSNQTQTGNLSFSAIEELLYAPDGGAATCGGFNVFGAGNVSAGCTAYIGRTTHNQTVYERNEAELDIAGTLWDLPAGPLGLALGVDWRNDHFDYSPDAILSSGDVIGFNGNPAVNGGYKVAEVYGETKIPLLADRPFFHYLGLEAGYRLSSYSSSAGTTSTWKYGGEWAITDWIRFRGMVQQAIRAPSVFELFGPNGQNFPGYADPCNATSPFRTGPNGAQVASLCQAQGIPAAVLPFFAQSTGQAEAIVGGNPHLSPEIAHTWTVGAVFTPRGHFGHWLDSLKASIDVYHINITGYIATIPPQTIIDNCFNAAGDNPTYSNANSFCGLFQRNAGGDVINIQQTLRNTGALKTSGADLDVDYRVAFSDLGASPAWGSMRFNFLLNYTNHVLFEPYVGAGFGELNGFIGAVAGSSAPKWKGVLNTTWNFTSPWGAMSLSWRENYVSKMTSNAGTADQVNTPDYWLANMSAAWDIKDNVQLFGGVSNVFDKQPPIFTGTPTQAGQQANTDPTVYDVIGRYFFVGVTAKF